MSIEDDLLQEKSPADLLAINQNWAIKLLKTRAPALVEQWQEQPDQLTTLAKQIEALEVLPLQPEAAPEKPYPTEALLGMDGAVREISEQLKISPALVGQCALGLVNAITQGLVDIKKPANPRPKPTSLFLLTGADSGEGKTLVDNILSNKLNERATDKDTKYQADRETYDLLMKAYHSSVKKVENQKGLDQEGKGLALQALRKPKPPMNPRFKASDVTIEGLGRQFNTGGCSRLSLMTDEGALIFGSHTLTPDRKNAVMARFCKMWDGERWDVDRGAEGNNYSLNGRRLSMSISTQPHILRQVMGDKGAIEQGFIPRFLLAMPGSRIQDRRMIKADWGKVPVIKEYWQKLQQLYDITPATREGHPSTLTPRILTLNKEATELHTAFGNQCFKDAGGRFKLIGAMTLKAEDNLLRLAATLTLWNKPHADVITVEEVKAATRLIIYYLNEGLRIAEVSSEWAPDSTLSMAAELLEWFKKKEFYLVYSRKLMKDAPRRKMRNKKTIKRLMNVLEEYGHAVRINGRPTIDGSLRKEVWLITSE